MKALWRIFDVSEGAHSLNEYLLELVQRPLSFSLSGVLTAFLLFATDKHQS